MAEAERQLSGEPRAKADKADLKRGSGELTPALIVPQPLLKRSR